MPIVRPFAYNPPPNPTISGTIQVGSLAVGYTDVEYSANYGGVTWWEGPDETLGYVICNPVSGGTQPNPVSIPAYVGFKRSKFLTEPSFIDIANYVAAGRTSPFTTGNQASTWLTNNGYWNSWVGQSLYLDSGNPSSYPGSGTTWYDLDGFNNGTLRNGVTYSPSYSGILQFNSSNAQYVSFTTTTNIPTGSSQYTLNAWFRPNSKGTLGIIGWGNWGSYNQVNALRLGNNLFINYWWGNDLVVPYSYNIGQWYNICVTFDGTYRKMYANGVQIGQDTPGTPNVGSASNMQVGTTNGSEYFNGSIPIVEVYPRALTSGEILTNYNTTYPRFVDPTPTPTPTNTATVTPTVTNTQTPTNTPTVTQTPTNTITQTQTGTPNVTTTPTNTPTNTITQTQTGTPNVTTTPTSTPTNTITPTNTSTPTQTPTTTITASQTVTPTPSITASQTVTPTVTNTPTQTRTPNVTSTPTNTPTPSITASQTVTPTVTNTPTQTRTPNVTSTPTNTPTVTKTPTNTPTNTPTPTRPAYLYYRWQITQTKVTPPDANCTQAAEFVFQIGGVDQSMAGVTVTNPSGSNPVGETPPNLVDNNLTTKALDLNFVTNGFTNFIFQFSSAKSFNGYRWATANDLESRDPKSWTIAGSNNGTTWTTLSTVSNFTATVARETWQTPQTY